MNVAIIDDQPILRLAVKSYFSESLPQSHCVEGSNGKEALEIIERSNLDLMLLDLAMPEMDGFELLNYLKKRRIKKFKIIVFTFYNDSAVIDHLLRLGVDGFLTKDSDPEIIKEAIERVMNGRPYFSTNTFSTEKILSANELSEKDRQIIEQLAQGRTSKEIALRLHYTKRTVETKKLRIERRFFAKNAAELISIAYRTGLLKI